MSLPSRVGAAALLAASLAGCQALGGGSGVMPASDLGPPPSLRSTMPGRETRLSNVDPDSGESLQTAPTRKLDLPKTARAGGPPAPAERRIRREDLEGGTEASGGGGGIAPAMGSNGSVGVGGKF